MVCFIRSHWTCEPTANSFGNTDLIMLSSILKDSAVNEQIISRYGLVF